jgi:hypothetical protein
MPGRVGARAPLLSDPLALALVAAGCSAAGIRKLPLGAILREE